jgi:hypothetical protein
MAVRIESKAEPIPGYTLLERLGGGFGEVWKAVAPGGLHKAIKFVYGDLEATGDEDQRAEQELKALSRVKSVRHPYILSLERYDIIDGQLMIVMELADSNLWDRFRECRDQGLPGIPREELLRYMEETAEALDLMNGQHQLQHLDIKPQNLFLVHNHAKVADFGLVKDLEGMMASVTGGVTPVYAAPETFDGWVSRFCDQYSLAIVYQELLTGQRPFNGNNVRQLILQHLQAAPNLEPLPECDREAIGRALSKNPDERYPTCQEFIRALGGGSAAAPEPRALPAAEARPAAPVDAGELEETPSDTHAKPGRPIETHSAPVLAATELPAEPPAGQTRWIRVHEGAQAPAVQAPAAPVPAHEVESDGLLFPAVVVGLGSLGLAVLQRLREKIHDQFGTVDALPNLRLLYLDTDPEALHQAAQGGPAAALGAGEVVHVKLNRPSHYLRSQHLRAHIDSWFNAKMLYRIPRSLVTTGMRALGRLAFFDNYRTIARRLKTELEACTDFESLSATAERTRLGLRSSRPRVYVVTSLAGGTGSGMFLDLAYVLRHLLKQGGHDDPEIVGVFLLPAVDRQGNRTLALGNAFAALTELNHFSAPGVTFSARYGEKDKPIQATAPPYDRCIATVLPAGKQDGPPREAAGLAGDFLFRELLTPLGRSAELVRNELATAHPPRGLTCQTFGLYRISSPRRVLLRNAARRLCRQLVQRWSSKDGAPVREVIRAIIADFWAQQELTGDHLMTQLQQTCADRLGQSSEGVLAALTEPLLQLMEQGSERLPAAVGGVLSQIEQLLGRPDLGAQPMALAEPLGAAADALTARWGEQLTRFAVQFIEQPALRLAGAEEAARQLGAAIEQALAHHEPLAKELTTRAAEAYSRIAPLLAGRQPTASGGRLPMEHLVEILRVYPKWRYQSLVLQRVGTIYVSLRGQLSDQLREINFCRARLGELLRSFEDPYREGRTSETACGHSVFPAGCRTLRDAVQQLLDTISPDELRDLDAKVQAVIQQEFQGLAHLCLTSSNLLDSLETAMQNEAEAFVEARLAGVNIADMYLTQHEDDEQTQDDLAAAFREAAPKLAGGPKAGADEVCILGVPQGPAGEHISHLAREALPEADLETAATADDIILYREIPRLPLADLEQLGPLAYEAYRQMSAVEHFTPHSRTDILEWRAAGA